METSQQESKPLRIETYTYQDWVDGKVGDFWRGQELVHARNEHGYIYDKYYRYMSIEDHDKIRAAQKEIYHQIVEKEIQKLKSEFLYKYNQSLDKDELVRSEIFIIDELLKNTSKKPLPWIQNGPNGIVLIGDKESNLRSFPVLVVRQIREYYVKQSVQGIRDYDDVKYEKIDDDFYLSFNNRHLDYQIKADAYTDYLKWLTNKEYNKTDIKAKEPTKRKSTEKNEEKAKEAYTYLTKTKKKTPDEAIEQMSKDFDVSSKTIERRLGWTK